MESQADHESVAPKKISIVIPVYNEQATIMPLLEHVERATVDGLEKEIIIVDDCSTDGTRDVLASITKPYTILLKDKNEGKGSAVRLGFLKSSGDITIIQDADLEYNPSEYSEIIGPIVRGDADVVFGSRFTNSKPHRVLYYWHYLGNRFLTMFSNALTNLNLTDMETCYKAFNRTALDRIKGKLSARRFGIEPELTALVAKSKLRVFEVGISYSGRTYAEGKKIGWKDGIAAIYHIIRYNLFS